MHFQLFVRCSTLLGAAAAAALISALPARAQPPRPVAAIAPPASPDAAAPAACAVTIEQVRFDHPLPRIARRLAAGKPIRIVAMGSSSTFGAGASTSSASYPSRLAEELTRRFPGTEITVLNRGVNGDELGGMLARLDSHVIAEKPNLVLWQLGTNSLLRDRSVPAHAVLLREGLARIKAAGAEVILIDPQYAPRVLAKPNIDAHRHRGEIRERRPLPPLRADAPLVRGRAPAVRDLRLRRRAAHERLELRLPRQGPRARHRRGGDTADCHCDRTAGGEVTGRHDGLRRNFSIDLSTGFSIYR